MLTALIASVIHPVAADILPDVSLLPYYLSQAYVSTNNQELPAGTPALRFPTASINLGSGRLELRGGEIVGSQQRVYQRVFRSDNTTYDRECGWFIYHPTHGHIHFEDWTQFILRKRASDGGIGEVAATGSKTSFCILEILDWDPSIPGHNTLPSYGSCGQTQGLRPGWADVYGATLDGQYINLTGIPNGDYYLQGFIDPNGQVLESNEDNNSVLVPISIGTPPTAVPDPYETNNSIAEVDAKAPGAPNSANFGSLTVKKTLRNLSMEDTADWFKFKTTKTGTTADYVKIESPWNRTADINLELYNSAGTLITRSASSYNYEQISLAGKSAGTYYVRVYRTGTAKNPQYWLTVNPAGSNPPMAFVDPPTNFGRETPKYVQKAYETIPINWAYDNPKNTPEHVTLFRSRTKDAADGESIDGFENIPGHVRSANILTNQFGVGKWHVFARFDSGGAFHDAWKSQTITVYRKGDTNFDGKVSIEEAQDLYHKYIKPNRPLPDGWDVICDMDYNGKVDVKDYQMMYLTAEHGGE